MTPDKELRAFVGRRSIFSILNFAKSWPGFLISTIVWGAISVWMLWPRDAVEWPSASESEITTVCEFGGPQGRMCINGIDDKGNIFEMSEGSDVPADVIQIPGGNIHH